MRIYLSGVNPENRISEILGEMGHEVLVSTDSERGNPNEFTPFSKIREADAVICDLTVRMGIDDHRMAFAEGKPLLSIRSGQQLNNGLSSFIRDVSKVAYITDEFKLKEAISNFLESISSSIESKVKPSKERR